MAHQNVPANSDLTAGEKRRNVIELVFGSDETKYQEFCETIRCAIPPDTAVVLRGSAVSGRRWEDGAPFDVDGRGTSDMDLTLVGDEAIRLFKLTGFFVPGIHSRPVSERDPDIAPALIPLRDRLMVRLRTCDVVDVSETRQASDHFPLLTEVDV